MSLDAKIAERLGMFRERPHDHHDHQWVDMTEEGITALDTGEPIQWWVCSKCPARRIPRRFTT